MELIIILSIVLIISVIDFFIYIKIKEKFQRQSQESGKEVEQLSARFHKLQEEVKRLKEKMEEMEGEYVRLKNKEVDKRIEQSSTRPTEVEVLLGEKLVTPEDIKKAKDFIENNNSPFSILDALVLLGKIDLKTSDYVKSKTHPE